MPAAFFGFDHLDVRVTSLATVERFYDALMPELGLPGKAYGFVNAAGDWLEPDEAHPYNAIEYHETLVPGELERFVGEVLTRCGPSLCAWRSSPLPVARRRSPRRPGRQARRRSRRGCVSPSVTVHLRHDVHWQDGVPERRRVVALTATSASSARRNRYCAAEASRMDVDLEADLADWPTGSALRGYRCVPANAVAAVLMVHGFGEHAGRHAKTMRSWAARGIAAYAYDQRGHGHSPGDRAIVTRFDDLVDDATAIRSRVSAEHPALPLFLFGVSMGGVVVTRSAQRLSDGLRGVVLLAPGFAVAEHIPPFVRSILRTVRKVAPGLKLQPLALSALSRDPAVGEAYQTDPLTYHGGVPLISGSELVDAGEAAIAAAPEYVVPTLLLQGDADKIAFPIGATRFVQAAKNNRDLTLKSVKGGYHELFNDPGGDLLAAGAADWMLARV